MIIVVDAYNLLRTVPPYKKTITDQERKQFIAQLHRYGRHKGHKVVIVFDGGPYEWPMKDIQVEGLLVVYSGINDTADDYIRNYIQTHKNQEMLLVSSDRELNRSAAALSIPSIDSIAFYQLLQQVKKNKSSKVQAHQIIVKTTTEVKDYVDELMKNASKIVPEKWEDNAYEHKNHASKKKQVTKVERQLLKKLGKL